MGTRPPKAISKNPHPAVIDSASYRVSTPSAARSALDQGEMHGYFPAKGRFGGSGRSCRRFGSLDARWRRNGGPGNSSGSGGPGAAGDDLLQSSATLVAARRRG